MKLLLLNFLFIGLSCLSPSLIYSQNNSQDTLLQQASLHDCVEYALKRQPLINESQIDEDIAETTIKSRLSEWYPQINFAYNLQHYLELPTSFFPDANGNKKPTRIGVRNTSNLQFSGTQNIFNRDLLLAGRTAADIRNSARQTTVSNKIAVIVDVSKAYYDLLLSQQQVKVLDENILRLERSYRDAFNQYHAGIVDKTDYKRAQISLNNTKADRKRAQDEINAKYATLKQLMGYPVQNTFSVRYDSLRMENEVFIDTLQQVQPANRIEYQLLQTQKRLQQANVKYYKWSFLPTVSAFGNYTPAFQNDRLASLYKNVYPTSLIGLQVAVPIFQGKRRIYDIRNANLQLTRLQWAVEDLNNIVNAEYIQALAAYKGSLSEYNSLKENLALAADVYNTLRLQYSAGIKTYLEVIIAETDLRSAQLNYLVALNQVLSSKLDMEKALGTVHY